jgi:hypothetical protein
MNSSRFRTIQLTIVLQRAVIVMACLLWMTVFSTLDDPAADGVMGWSRTPATASMPTKDMLVTVIIGLSVIERMCAVVRLLSHPSLIKPTEMSCFYPLLLLARRSPIASKTLQ